MRPDAGFRGDKEKGREDSPTPSALCGSRSGYSRTTSTWPVMFGSFLSQTLNVTLSPFLKPGFLK